jgi:hypothetical protein
MMATVLVKCSKILKAAAINLVCGHIDVIATFYGREIEMKQLGG